MNMVLHVKGFGCKLDFEGGAFREDQFVFGDESHGTLAAMRRKYGYADRWIPAFRRVFDSKGIHKAALQ